MILILFVCVFFPEVAGDEHVGTDEDETLNLCRGELGVSQSSKLIGCSYINLFDAVYLNV